MFDCQRQLVWHHVKLDMLTLVKRHLTTPQINHLNTTIPFNRRKTIHESVHVATLVHLFIGFSLMVFGAVDLS